MNTLPFNVAMPIPRMIFALRKSRVFFKMYLFILERVSERRRDGEVFHLMIHTLNIHNNQSKTDPKLEAKRFSWVSHTGMGSQGAEP